MEKFAERYITHNPDFFSTADAAFILAFSIIILNTDLHNPAIHKEQRMTKEGFLRNDSKICDGKDLPPELLNSIFDRIKSDPISLKEDDDLREKESDNKGGSSSKSCNTGLFANNFSEMNRKRESDYQKERDQILRNTESLLKQKKKKGFPQPINLCLFLLLIPNTLIQMILCILHVLLQIGNILLICHKRFITLCHFR